MNSASGKRGWEEFDQPESKSLPSRERASGRAAVRSELIEAVDSLMNSWCERGAAGPLQILLRAYPGPLWHDYHRMELLESLESLTTISDELTAKEKKILADLLRILKDRPASAPDAESEN